MAIGVRGFNPIWTEFDLSGHLFDDNFWFYVLENTIPYIPETVYHDADLTIPWTNPIRFLANGTLPVDIFFDPDKVYRLEFRQNLGLLPPSQNDPLIYEVNDYVANGSGVVPTPVVSLTSDNEITNGQFALINFASPLTITAAGTYEIAPGWFLDLGGSGSAVITQVPLNSTNPNPTNAPYALHLVLSGWTSDSVILRQRFQQNGILWSGKIAATSVTARSGVGLPSMVINLVDSHGTPLGNLLTLASISGAFNEYTGHTPIIPASTNTDIPPAAYIEYQVLLQSNVDIYLTSFQITVSNTIAEPIYIQDTVDRQIDHTFHYYKDSLLREQKQSVLTGWDFGLNPWQFYASTVTNAPTNLYTADQTIVIQQAYVDSATGNNISTSRGTVAQNYGFVVTSVTATNQFALIQYIDPTTIRTGWGKIFSSLVKLVATIQTTSLGVKMRLIYRTSIPSSVSRTEPVSTWAANGEPVFAAGWTSISAKNNPVYILTNGANTLLFEGFSLPASTNADMTLGVMIYTTGSMVQTGTPDKISFESISLVQNDFAIQVPSLTFDETLRRCEYYFRKSFLVGTVPVQNAGADTGESWLPQPNAAGTADTIGAIIRFSDPMRATPSITLYNPSVANAEIRDQDAGLDWSATTAPLASINSQGFLVRGTTPALTTVGDLSGIHWVANAVIGR